MPQLIAMVIVVVGAMIYMFQTFGGTGDKIEGIAQKSSIITEINNIKDGLKIAAKSKQIAETDSGDAVNSLHELGELSYFADQINEQVIANNAATPSVPNTYYAISFGGEESKPGGMAIKLAVNKNHIPGIYVDLSVGTLADNAAFLEAQIASDLEAVAHIDRHATAATTGSDSTVSSGLNSRIPVDNTAVTTAGSETAKDGKFIVYFKDFGSDEVVK